MKKYINRPNKKGNTTLLAPLIISIILHLILFLILFVNPDLLKIQTKKDPPKKKEYIEITEFPVPKEKETKPPEKAKRLAEKSHKAKEEKTKDAVSRLSKRSTNKPKIVKKPTIVKRPAKTVKKKTPQKTQKKSEDKNKLENKSDSLRDQKLASLPKQKWLRPKKDTKKELEQIRKKILESSPGYVSKPSQSELPPLMGSRDVKKKEETVDLNTKEFKYHSYFLKLKRQIEGVWHYPKESVERGERGYLNLVFTISSNGYLEDIRIVKSSGYDRLDFEALRAIRVASPYNPLPKSWDLEKLNVRASFEYRFGWLIR